MLRFSHFFSAAIAALFATSTASAQFSAGYVAGQLNDASGQALSDGSLVLLIADTSGDGFGSLFAGSSLSAGSFVNANDVILHRSFIDPVLPSGSVNTFTGTLSFSSFSGLTAGDALALVWFSNLDSSSNSLTAGDNYGLFVGGPNPLQEDPWITPSAGNSIELRFLTGTEPDTYGFSAGDANLTVSAIPEPSTYAAILGVGVLGFAIYRRKRR